MKYAISAKAGKRILNEHRRFCVSAISEYAVSLKYLPRQCSHSRHSSQGSGFLGCDFVPVAILALPKTLQPCNNRSTLPFVKLTDPTPNLLAAGFDEENWVCTPLQNLETSLACLVTSSARLLSTPPRSCLVPITIPFTFFFANYAHYGIKSWYTVSTAYTSRKPYTSGVSKPHYPLIPAIHRRSLLGA